MTAEAIARALGGRKVGRGWTARCPAHDDSTPSLSIRDSDDNKVLLYCHAGCDQRDVISALKKRGIWADDRPHPQSRVARHRPVESNLDEEDARRSAVALNIWRSCTQAQGTVVESYLKSRGIYLPPSDALRFHAAMKHPSGGFWPAMVALVTSGIDGAPVAVHRTFLAGDGGGKAPVDPQKMMLGPCRGGAVRLADPGEVLMVGEGIETCLAAMQASGHPAWAALSTSGLRALDLPKDVRDVIVLADGDEAGEAAALDCALRWKREGRRVRIARPPLGAAEDIADPLDGLIEKIADDPGAAFTREVLERLAALKKDDRAAFELLRSKLKKAGCRVTALDEAIAEENGDAGRGPTQADILIDLAQAADLFHAPDGTGFADLDINGHRETWPIRAKGFRRWLARRFFEETGGAPSSEALQSALNVIEAKAHFDAPERQVHIRVGGLDGRLYLDLGDEAWRAIEIDATGWRIVDNPPVRFRRASGMKVMPIPVGGGSIETLRSFLNVQSDTDFVLVVAWALACLRTRGPYPVIVLSGEQGSAKSTFSSILRALLDPNTAPLRALPREDRDLFIAASNGHVLAFDNVSGLPAWISDTLCRLATGGGFAVRQLYTDQDEVLFDAARPVILNGIEDIVTRPDLADRAVFLTLEPIPEERRRPEAELWAAFEAERPRILGVLLDAVVEGLKRLPNIHLPRLPRMADFALWATACETALWPDGTFWSAYCGNRDEAVEGVIEADPIAAAVRAVMGTRTVWTGNASDLLGALGEVVGERVTKSKTWPDSPRALSGRLRRAATFLRKIGIEITFEREGRSRTRIIRITAASANLAPEHGGAQPSAPSASSALVPNIDPLNGLAAPDLRTVADGADGSDQAVHCTVCATVRANPLKCNGETDADGTDANCPLQSAPEKTGWSGRL